MEKVFEKEKILTGTIKENITQEWAYRRHIKVLLGK